MIGVKNLPITSVIFVSFITNTIVIIKNRMEERIGEACPNIGSTPISKVVEAVRGIANKGPITNISNVQYRVLKRGETLEAKSSSLPQRVNANTPNNGSPTPVIKKPMLAMNHDVPEL